MVFFSPFLSAVPAQLTPAQAMKIGQKASILQYFSEHDEYGMDTDETARDPDSETYLDAVSELMKVDKGDVYASLLYQGRDMEPPLAGNQSSKTAPSKSSSSTAAGAPQFSESVWISLMNTGKHMMTLVEQPYTIEDKKTKANVSNPKALAQPNNIEEVLVIRQQHMHRFIHESISR